MTVDDATGAVADVLARVADEAYRQAIGDAVAAIRGEQAKLSEDSDYRDGLDDAAITVGQLIG